MPSPFQQGPVFLHPFRTTLIQCHACPTDLGADLVLRIRLTRVVKVLQGLRQWSPTRVEVCLVIEQ